MPTSLRYPLAVIIGWCVALAVVYGVEKLGHVFYPPPSSLHINDQQQLSEYINSLPFGALLFVILAWFVAIFCGGLAACYIAKGASMVMAFLVGLLIFVSALSSLMVLDRPLWFSVITLVGLPIVIAITGRIGRRFQRIQPDQDNSMRAVSE
ncbi:hypothetical protein QWY77_04520 [Thalassotalea ponticola]|uniref:hypothetical protein n=1 Tax=Thalassotalea ponticola TaxID=1523392 RepID=UPI0025B5FA7B|nr:hypothetical protein [Thalassotalea ponticola]MDN3652031.1 hypothetical protein [Thalassotalea ponticola]